MIHHLSRLLGAAEDQKSFVYQCRCGLRVGGATFDLAGEDLHVEDGSGDSPCPKCLPHLAAQGMDAAGVEASGTLDADLGDLETEGEDEVLATEIAGEDDVISEETRG